MSKHRREQGGPAQGAVAQAGARPAPAKTPARVGWRRIPVWGWALIFILPLALSEFMFYQVGRTMNMVLFPIVWAGFWITIWYRSTH